MPLVSGTRLGPYEILSPIGKGGMGEVYRARDTRLNREVAIKTSSEGFSERFAREARTIAALNHSNICQLYDVGDNYLVMEFVAGKRLRGPLPLHVALRYALQICDALDSAHRKGIVHRDLKPDNILVTKSGVKVLDFGLAKRSGPVAQMDATQPVTQEGSIIGTLHYMSPEQLQSKEVDQRSDIFSFGVVLYQMLTGKPAFDGPSAASIVGAILERPAPSIEAFAPPALDHLLHRCLSKDPDDRWQTVRDLRDELEWIANHPAAVASGKAKPATIAPRIPWVVASLCLPALLIVSALWWRSAHRPLLPHPVTYSRIEMPGNNFIAPVISPDGARLLYVQHEIPPRFWLRPMDQFEGHPIPGTEGGEWGAFSPDGQWIVFLKGPAPFKIAKILINGGVPIILASQRSYLASPFWCEDGTILAGSPEGLVRISAGGGEIESLTKTDQTSGEIAHFEPVLLPGGRAIVFSIGTGPSVDSARTNAKIAVLDLKSHLYQTLPYPGSTPNYAPTGHLVYRRGAKLFALPFDVGHLKVSGVETPVLEGLSPGMGMSTVPYSFARSGALVYRSGTDNRETAKLTWTDGKAAVQDLPEPAHAWVTVPLSPNGQKVVAELPESDVAADRKRIWIYDMTRRVLTPLTSGMMDFAPIWTPDGRWVTFASNHSGTYGIYNTLADSGSVAKLLLTTDSLCYPGSWTPDGKTLVFYEVEQSKSEIFLLPVSADGKAGQPRRYHPEANFSEQQPVVSPDGKWLAYSADDSGRFEVYVSPLDGSGGRFQVSTEGGRLPRWSPNGRQLYYVELNPRRLMVAEISFKPKLSAANPRALFTIRNDNGAVYYDVASDGKRFLVLTPQHNQTSALTASSFVLVTNWFDELSNRVSLQR